MDRLEEGRLFAGGEVAPGTKREPRHAQWADPHAAQSFDGNPGGVHHVPHHVVRPFVDHHLEDEAFRRLTKDPEFLRHHAVPVGDDAAPYPLQDAVVRPGERQDVVLLVEFVAGMHDPIGDIAVVGEKEEPLGVAVESPDRVNPLRNLDDVHHGAAVSLVLRRGDVAARFVEDEVARSLRAQQLAVDADLGANRIGLRAELGDDRPVDADPTG